MKTILIATLFGLALPMLGFAQTVPPAKPASPEDALQKAIDAVNREVEKSKKADEPVGSSGKPGEPAKPAVGKTVPPKPKPPPSARPTKPPAANPQESQPPITRITGEEDADFLNKEGVVRFRKNVLVDRIDLKIWCDELHVTLNQTAKKATAQPADPPPTAKPEEESDAFSAQNVKQALAKSAPAGFVVIWRKTPKGEIAAMAREALYDGATGNITLKGVPEAVRDLKLHVASGGEGDHLVLMKNGNVNGGKHTGFVPENQARDIRKRILGHAPVRRGGPPAGGPSPVPSPPTIPSTVEQ